MEDHHSEHTENVGKAPAVAKHTKGKAADADDGVGDVAEEGSSAQAAAAGQVAKRPRVQQAADMGVDSEGGQEVTTTRATGKGARKSDRELPNTKAISEKAMAAKEEADNGKGNVGEQAAAWTRELEAWRHAGAQLAQKMTEGIFTERAKEP